MFLTKCVHTFKLRTYAKLKKTEGNLSDTSSESEDEEILRFQDNKSWKPTDDSPQANLSPFVIEKVISVNLKAEAV